MYQNEDEIIAQGLANIREGIVSGNWKLVCDGYNSISGDELVPIDEKPKSRLEFIREKLSQIKPATPVSNKRDWNSLSVKELKQEIKNRKLKVNSVGKSKKVLIGFLEDSDVKGDESEDELNDELLINDNDISTTEQKGGKKFGRGRISIISDAYDEDIASKNAKFAKKKIKVPRRKVVPSGASSKNEDAAFRFHNENRRPAQALDR